MDYDIEDTESTTTENAEESKIEKQFTRVDSYANKTENGDEEEENEFNPINPLGRNRKQ